MCVVTLSHGRRGPATEDPGKGCFSRGQAGSSQERKNEAFGRRAEFLWQTKVKYTAAPVLGKGTHARWGRRSQPSPASCTGTVGKEQQVSHGGGFSTEPLCYIGSPNLLAAAMGCSTPGKSCPKHVWKRLEELKIEFGKQMLTSHRTLPGIY